MNVTYDMMGRYYMVDHHPESCINLLDLLFDEMVKRGLAKDHDDAVEIWAIGGPVIMKLDQELTHKFMIENNITFVYDIDHPKSDCGKIILSVEEWENFE